MAATRVVSQRRLCVRYKFFFYVAACIIVLQLYMGFTFYTVSESGMANNDRNVGRNVLDVNALESRQNHSLDRPNRQAIVERHNVDKVGDQPVNGNRKIYSKNYSLKVPKQESNNHIARAVNHIPVPVRENEEKAVEPFNPGCDLSQNLEALSAIVRAKTRTCQEQLSELACNVKAGLAYPKQLPRYCPLMGKNGGKYIGCFRDDKNDRDLNGEAVRFEVDNTPQKCVDHCLRIGYQYAGVQYMAECWCANQYGTHGPSDEHNCDSKCTGDASQACGGYLANRVFHTGLGDVSNSTAKPVNSVGMVLPQEVEHLAPARVVYMLTINGRALRQVNRLIKAIYHADSYIYIHVDLRQEYLYRHLLKLAEKYENIRLTPWRMSTIWGGASLLTMLLRAMKDLLQMSDWQWDFFINLSESDYPIKKHEDLITFLTKYKRFNFVRSHSGSTYRFMRKQGLDKTFLECETRMWRIGTRSLPGGIRFDGGSDWIGLNRKFITYVTSSTDELVTGLMQVYKYSLLPAESFFHTVLQNSEYCNMMVTHNNLHMTNWNRKRGCKCQYKHIVDWCGCSPNDFTEHDWVRLKAQATKPVFFARKFEPIVSQKIINIVDTDMLLEHLPDDLPGLNSYWQNIYHHEDTDTPADDAASTLYYSLSRRIMRSLYRDNICYLSFTKLLEVNTYNSGDKLQGFLILFEATDENDKPIQIEAWFSKKRKYVEYSNEGLAGRLSYLEAGTLYDPKEDLFRNYGGFLGPYSNFSIRHVWDLGEQLTAQFVLIDPASQIAAVREEAIKTKDYSDILTFSIKMPLRPGTWTAKLLHSWQIVAEVEFLVTPLSRYNHEAISDKKAEEIHKGAQNYKDDFSGVAKLLNIKNSDKELSQANRKAHYTGEKLREWIDNLADDFFNLKHVCVYYVHHNNKKENRVCGRLPLCIESEWSSLSPDPKSEIVNLERKSEKSR